MNPPTYEELLKALKDAYQAMYSEYMYCPECTGHIGLDNEWHDEFCLYWRIPGIMVNPSKPPEDE